jgi:hypothetical protein|tara:strand:- start:5475 stop:6335 length:861 start_codon:yes stop_codon:yes gene_type:complete|mmetsp:Transcript_6537/g.24662  ORF Transcript_6537/g.24662 Transcript_6537/m.24662 type:complete len:287 (+) Transcript_6537:304-1164(+)
MQAWRRAFQSNEARFVCVCVDGRAEATAREFQRLYFDRDMINAFIDANADFPRFQTQLGCQGLVVIDAEGCFATQRSPAFLHHRNESFRFVESAVRALASARSTTASRDRDGGESNASASAKVDVARFAENACAETPVDLDDTEALVCTKLPFVGHSKMDSDHAEIERLMRRALASVTARDARALTEAFSKHAAEEEALLRDAEDMEDKASGVSETQERTPCSFRASSSHATDHARVLSELRLAVSATETDDNEAQVSRKKLETACRAIVEHAVTYDAAYAGKLVA